MSKVGWTSQLSYEILRSSLERKFDKTNFVSPKSTPFKSPCLLGLNKKDSFGLFLFSFFHLKTEIEGVIISLFARSKQIPKNRPRWNGPFEENNEIYWKSLRKIRQVRRGQDPKKEQAHSKRDWFLHGYFGKNTSYWAKPQKGDCKVR